MHPVAVKPTIVNGMASAPATNRTIYAAVETRGDAVMIPGTLMFGPQHQHHSRKRKRDEQRRGAFPLVVPWATVSKTATERNLVNVGYAAAEEHKLINADDGTPVDDKDLRLADCVPTQSKTHIFGVWNSGSKPRDRIASVAVSGVVEIVLEAHLAAPIIGLTVGFTRDTGVPRAFLSVPSTAESFGTIIGPSKRVPNSAEYKRIGFTEPTMVPVLLHIREAAKAPKPADIVAQFAENVFRATNRIGPADEIDRLSRVLNKSHLAISVDEATATVTPTIDAAVRDAANGVVTELLKDTLDTQALKTAAEKVLIYYFQAQDDPDDDYPWYKLARYPFGWKTMDATAFQYNGLAEGDYVCMGLTALRLFMTRNPMTV